jgi:acyl-CoA thioester hydrolase
VTYATWTIDSVRYADSDPNGHVNNGAVNQYFEDGRVHFRSERMTFLGENLFTGFAVGRFSAIYHAALTYPATVDIGTVVTIRHSTSGKGCSTAMSVSRRQRWPKFISIQSPANQ